MLIINADDWGRTQAETVAAAACFSESRIASATAMVFMDASERAAELASQIRLDVGLHLNLTQEFTGKRPSEVVLRSHTRVCRFLNRNKYARMLYLPFLREDFARVYRAQAEEFLRLYGKRPSHIDGHHHMHLCANILGDCVIPRGEKVRRSFSFRFGEKGRANRTYRRFTDWLLARRNLTTDYFFDLCEGLRAGRLQRIAELATRTNVELMVHPIDPDQYSWLISDRFLETFGELKKGSYANL
ncbi:MAG TPA: ChbG/HpnK family deacetylase [Candidatus Acidoferrum sp.]|jgi:predicted glycoside hydrolase/deacetylase ChbG (UPF0249 family)|nr:ChbG/HpnK family deacetylase [Candidatus Acidoferrum sp.]